MSAGRRKVQTTATHGTASNRVSGTADDGDDVDEPGKDTTDEEEVGALDEGVVGTDLDGEKGRGEKDAGGGDHCERRVKCAKEGRKVR